MEQRKWRKPHGLAIKKIEERKPHGLAIKTLNKKNEKSLKNLLFKK